MERWKDLADIGYHAYEVSDQGRIRNKRTGRVLRFTTMPNGVLKVGLIPEKGELPRTITIAPTVAHAFLPIAGENFNTVININGDRSDCRVENLAWRPRWFAIKFNRQLNNPRALVETNLIDIDSGRLYVDSRDLATSHGLLETDVILSCVNHKPMFPTRQRIRFAA